MINSYYINPQNIMKLYNTKFCFITSSYNQSQFIYENINSILLQDYETYRIIYVNDASTDNSLDILNEIIETHHEIDIQLITNKKRLGPAYSRFIGCQYTNDDEICVFLDGDDTLYSKDVLRIISEVYQNPNIHATFGSIYGRPWQLKHRQLYTRSSSRIFFPHLRTAKAYFCKKVPKSYLIDEGGNWFMFCTDVALFMAIIELIDYNYAFIRNPLVIYNTYNTLNNPTEGFSNQNVENKHKRLQYHKTIKSMSPLPPIIYYKSSSVDTNNRFLIIRMLGNDLKGLHGSNQTLENLLFTVNHESEFRNTDKIYILNRIIDADMKEKFKKILYSKKIKYIDIPFNRNKFDELPLLNMELNNFSKITRRGEIIKLLYPYNQVIVNNNGCRNFCIEYGKRTGYLWTFVLDSNSFFTEVSYNNIINNINSNAEYLIIPQKRVKDGNYTNNDILRDPDIETHLPIQEPQIAFRNTSEHTFNPYIPYGAAPKAELLNAMDVNGRWNKWGSFLKSIDISPREISNVKFQVCGSVLRLHPHNHTNKMGLNWNKRMRSLFILVKRLQRKNSIIIYNEHDLTVKKNRSNQIVQTCPESDINLEEIRKDKLFSKVHRFFN